MQYLSMDQNRSRGTRRNHFAGHRPITLATLTLAALTAGTAAHAQGNPATTAPRAIVSGEANQTVASPEQTAPPVGANSTSPERQQSQNMQQSVQVAQASGGTSTTTTGNNRTYQRNQRGEAGDGGYSVLPYTQRGYVGVNLGKPEYTNGCGSGGFSCGDPDLSGRIYTGGYFNDYFGLEVGYLNMGRADRAGGRTRAEGLNLSLLGRVPLGDSFSAFAKGGATYGRTRVSSDALSGVSSGKDRGWGGSYGAGLSWDINPKSSVVLEWERHDFNFVNEGKQAVKNTSLGYVHKF